MPRHSEARAYYNAATDKYACPCLKCCGKEVSRVTFYRHRKDEEGNAEAMAARAAHLLAGDLAGNPLVINSGDQSGSNVQPYDGAANTMGTGPSQLHNRLRPVSSKLYVSNVKYLISSSQEEQSALTAQSGVGSYSGEGHGNEDHDMDVSLNILPCS